MGAFQVVLILYGLAAQALGAPAPKADGEVSGSVSASGIPPFLTFKDGSVGVNFFGFKASAGLGGLLTGDSSHGGLHAEAETPFGQKAGAGLGGRVDGSGRSIGGLYAGATAGGGVGAMAGLDGVAGAGGSAGRSYAGASAGGVSKTVIKESVGVPATGEASISGSLNIQKIAPPPPPPPHSNVHIQVVKEKLIAPPPKSQVNIEVFKEAGAAPPPPAVKKTYVERTVIPNYIEKTIQVPSYVEKTIRVPTVVEKRVKVPAPPTIIEKEVEVPQPIKTVTKTKQVVLEEDEAPVPPTATVVKTKTKIYRRPWLHVRKRINFNSGEAPYYGGVVAGGTNVDATANSVPDSYGGYGGFGHFGYGANYGPPATTYTKTVRKQFNGDLIRDIFNIPIATLGAVGNFVGNIAGGVGGSVAVSKSYGSTYRK